MQCDKALVYVLKFPAGERILCPAAELQVVLAHQKARNWSKGTEIHVEIFIGDGELQDTC